MKTNNSHTIRFFVTMMALNFFTAQTASAQAPSFKIISNSGMPANQIAGVTAQIVNEKDAKIVWATADEQTANYFVIERSINGAAFKQAAIIFSNEAAEGNSYTFTDRGAAEKGNEIFYRISTVYKNGTVQSSNITAINFTTTTSSKLTHSVFYQF
jgi:hypothetical protein